MNVAELIKQLEKLPQDLPLRMVDESNDEENLWVYGVNFSITGDRGYEISGEVRLLVSE
jgi:hypothetical protein